MRRIRERPVVDPLGHTAASLFIVPLTVPGTGDLRQAVWAVGVQWGGSGIR